MSTTTAQPKSYMDIYGGKNVIVRTVTFHYTGRLVGQLIDGALVLEDVAWIAGSGRWAEALEQGPDALDEVEPYPAGPVAVSAVVDVSEWKHELPRATR